MKTHAAFAKSLLVVASFAFTASLPAQAPAKRKPAPAPAQQEETAKPEGSEEDIVLPGTEVKRSNGTFVSITVENNAFKIAFYDAKKKQQAPDVARAAIRWEPKNKKGDDRRILNPAGDGMTLVSPPPVLPPYNFRIFVTLLNEANEAVETFNTDFRM